MLFKKAIWLFRLPLRNVWRNRRRSIVTIGSIVIGTVSLMMFLGYIRIMEIGLTDQAINKDYGHFQIGTNDVLVEEDNSLKTAMSEEEWQVVKNIVNNIEELEYINYRLHISGLIGNEHNSTSIFATASFPETETFMLPDIVSGNIYKRNNSIILGRQMAKTLGNAKPGDNFVIMSSGVTGAQEATAVEVSGIYKGLMKSQESIFAFMPMDAAWDLVGEKLIHRVMVILNDNKDLKKNVRYVKDELQKVGLDLEVKTWEDLGIFYKQVIALFQGIALVVGAILFIIIVFNISNTMYMVVSERTREIGTMRAMGDSRGEIIFLILREGFMISLIGVSLGVIIGLIITPIINNLGISLPPAPGQDEPMLVYIELNTLIIVKIVIFNLMTGIVAAYFPAKRAAHLNVVESIRQI